MRERTHSERRTQKEGIKTQQSGKMKKKKRNHSLQMPGVHSGGRNRQTPGQNKKRGGGGGLSKNQKSWYRTRSYVKEDRDERVKKTEPISGSKSVRDTSGKKAKEENQSTKSEARQKRGEENQNVGKGGKTMAKGRKLKKTVKVEQQRKRKNPSGRKTCTRGGTQERETC